MISILSTFLVLAASPLFGGLNEDLAQLSEDHSAFAFSLYPTLATPDDNLVFSPYSIATCLGMVYLGARGDTELQMQKAMHWEIDRKNFAKTSAALNQSLLSSSSTDKVYQLNIANALWLDQGTFLLTDFRYAIEQQFKAKLGKINFSLPENAVSTINSWTSEQTQGKIPQLLTPGDLSPATRLLLTNAVYFEGNWTLPFDPKMTQDWPFQPSTDTSMNVKMMHQVLSIPYFENELMQAAALPFIGKSEGGGTLAFVIVLPKSAQNFNAVANELDDELDDWISSMTPQQVDLKLPKFSLNSRYDLKAPLQQLGMEDPFDSDANFVGIDGLRDLFLNNVIHQAYFTLGENGVTAAATTAVSINVTSAKNKIPPVPLIADHPFLFFIVDMKSQEMLFMGQMIKPSLN